MRNHARLSLFLIPAFMLAACDGSNNGDGPACTLEARPAISVTVQIDGGGVPEDGTLEAIAREGSFEDSQPVAGGAASLAHERAGTYVVEVVEVDGSGVLWTQSDVVVTEDQCHVTTVHLTALVEQS